MARPQHPCTHRDDTAADDLPFAPSCERNREPILGVLRTAFAARHAVLEIGSGTGQHAVHFAGAMPWLTWQCSERAEHLPGLQRRLDAAALPNTPPTLMLDVCDRPWPDAASGHGDDSGVACLDAVDVTAARADAIRFDAAFTANTLHIMGWDGVQAFFAGLDSVLAADATLVVYGPFNEHGAYSSDSNREFDAWLKARDPRSGLRDSADVDALAAAIGLCRSDDIAMPANNRCLVWQRGDTTGGAMR